MERWNRSFDFNGNWSRTEWTQRSNNRGVAVISDIRREPLLASECRVYVYNLALRLGVPVKGGGLKEGIEVFPRQDRLEDGEFGNAIRAPLGVHRKTNRRYWFYEADLTPEAQLAYLDGLTKLTEAQLRTFIAGMSLPKRTSRSSQPLHFDGFKTVPGVPDSQLREADPQGQPQLVGKMSLLRHRGARPFGRQPRHSD